MGFILFLMAVSIVIGIVISAGSSSENSGSTKQKLNNDSLNDMKKYFQN